MTQVSRPSQKRNACTTVTWTTRRRPTQSMSWCLPLSVSTLTISLRARASLTKSSTLPRLHQAIPTTRWGTAHRCLLLTVSDAVVRCSRAKATTAVVAIPRTVVNHHTMMSTGHLLIRRWTMVALRMEATHPHPRLATTISCGRGAGRVTTATLPLF